MKNPNTTLFAGEQLTVTLKDETTVLVRVREMPARHHLELVELFHVGREADLIQRCTERGTVGEAAAVTWSPIDAVFVDSLSDPSHLQLAEMCERLNFDRAIATAQRLIARGQKLGPLMETIAKQVMEPMRKELGSWMSSLTTQISAALAEKKP